VTEISFVVICYNHARYAARVARYLRLQKDVEDAEYIFVDDGSTDGTTEALQAATAGWPNTTVYRQENKGPSNAMNKGLSLATGTYVKLVGGDDLLHPDATRVLRAALIAEDAVYAFGKLDGFDMDRDISNEDYWTSLMKPIVKAERQRIDDPLRFLVKGMTYNPSCVLMRRDHVIAAGGSDESLFVEDFSLSLRMALRGTFVSISEFVAYGPSDDDQRLSHDNAQTLHDMNAALSGLLRDHPELSRRRRNMIARSALGRGWKWARRHEGKNIFSRIGLMNTLANIRIFGYPVFDSSVGMMDTACKPFREQRTLRGPKVSAQ